MKNHTVQLIAVVSLLFLIVPINADTYFKITEDKSHIFPTHKKIKVNWGKANYKGNMNASYSVNKEDIRAILHFKTNWWTSYKLSIGLELISKKYGSYGIDWLNASQHLSLTDYCWNIKILKPTNDWPVSKNSFSISSC